MGKKFTVIPKNTFDALELDAGVLLKTFDPDNPVAPKDEDIICATTGGVNPSCVPTYSDFGEDVDNVPNNMMEFKHLDGWDCKISTTGLGTSPELIRLALGAADISGTKITPRSTIQLTDFSDLWWVGDKANGGMVAVKLMNALSTGGFSLQTAKNGKGTVALEITGHVSINAQNIVPMEFYSSDVDSFSDLTVAPETDAATFPWTDKKASDMQSGLTVANDAITGELYFIEDGLSPSGPLSGSGNFMALKFSDLDPDATSVKIGLQPSYGTGLVEIINDPDKNAVLKVHDNTQKFVVVQSDGTNSHTQTFDLSGLTLDTE